MTTFKIKEAQETGKYKKQMAALNNNELKAEYKSLSELCSYLSPGNPYHAKLAICKGELLKREIISWRF